jgi:ParB family chromosome partitioning protein
MSSFKAKVAKAEKQKGTNEARRVETHLNVSARSHPSVREQEAATEPLLEQASTIVLPANANIEALYGEDQHEDGQDQQKFERTIPVDRIRPNPFQHRKTFDQGKLDELAAGMKVHGWIGGGLPVRAHATEANVYELVWGERRWRAARSAGLTAIPCVITAYSDDDMIEKGLLENVQREDLSNLEEGLAYVSLLTLRTESGKPRYSIRRLAAQIGKDKSYIEDRLQYARIPLDVQQLAEDQPDISPRIIRELGELSKILQPEERAPVIEGVRAGKLRIEDVHEIRKDVEREQTKKEPTTAQFSIPVKQPESKSTMLSTTTPLSVASNTPLLPTIMKERALEEDDQEKVDPTIQDTVSPSEPTSMATVVVVSVFEKMLKRDNEALERIVQHITDTFENLTANEQDVLRRYIQRWNTSFQELMTRLEQSFVNEEAE